MSTKSLLVKNLPEFSSDLETYIELFFEKHGSSDVKKIEINAVSRQAVVTFSEPVPDVGKLQEKLSNQSLRGQVITLSAVHQTRFLVTNISSSIREETLGLYFENKKSGNSGNDDVTIVEYQPSTGRAILEIKNEDVVREICSRKHSLYGSHVEVALCGPLFMLGADLTTEKEHETLRDPATCDDTSYQGDHSSAAAAASETCAAQHAVTQHEKMGMAQSEESPTRMKYPKKDHENKSERYQTRKSFEEKDHKKSREEFQTGTKYPVKDHQKMSEGYQTRKSFEEKDHEKMSEGYQTRKSFEENDHKKMSEGYQAKKSFKEKDEKQSAISPTATKDSAAGHSTLVSFSSPTDFVTEKCNFNEIHFQLLQQADEAGSDFGGLNDLRFDQETCTITITGTKSDVANTRMNILTKITAVEDSELKVSPVIGKLMKKPRAKQLMEQRLKMRNINAVVYVKNEKMIVTAFSDTEAHKACRLLESIFDTRSIKVTRGMVNYVESESWLEFRNKIEKSSLVSVTYEAQNHLLVVEGSKDDMDSAVETITKKLKENEIHHEEILLKRGVWRYLQKYGVSQLNIQEICSSDYLRYYAKHGKYYLSISGPGKSVDIARIQFEERITPQVLFSTLELSKLGLSVESFRSGLGKMMIDSIENNNICVIEPRKTKETRQNNPRHTRPQLSRQRSMAEASATDDAPSEPDDDNESSSETEEADSDTAEWLGDDSMIEDEEEKKAEEEDDASDIETTIIGDQSTTEEPEEELSEPEKFDSYHGNQHEHRERGTSNVKVVKGNITDIKTTILVVTVGNEGKQLRGGGALAKLASQAGGAEIEKAYSQYGPVEAGKVLYLKACGQLMCDYVYVMGLKAWKGTENNRKALAGMVRTCIEQAMKYNIHSILFPTIGCGTLGFPPDEVTRCIVKSAAHAPKLQVSIVCYDDKSRSIFQDCLDQCGSERQMSPQGRSSGYRGQGHYKRHNQHRRSSPRPTTVTPERKSPAKTSDAPPKDARNQRAGTVFFHVNYKDDRVINNVKKALHDKVKELYEEKTVTNDYIEKLTNAQCYELYKLAKREVHMSINRQRKEILLAGMRDKVIQVRDLIVAYLEQVRAKTPVKPKDYNELRKKMKTPQLLEMISREPLSVPPYWKHYHDQNVWDAIKNVFEKLRKSFQVTVDEKTLKAVSEIVYGTWQKDSVGHGADAIGLNHKGLKILSVKRIESVDLFYKYINHRNLICMKGAHKAIPKVDGLLKERAVMTAKYRLNRALIPEINEHYLFHGTQSKNVGPVISQGFDNRLAGVALFGRGTYFAESSTKADQYADDRSNRSPPGTKLYMLLVRVTLGNVFVSTSQCEKRVRPPCMGRGCQSERCNQQHEMYDSLLGTHHHQRLAFREFVIYDSHKCYPEYLIEYVRK